MIFTLLVIGSFALFAEGHPVFGVLVFIGSIVVFLAETMPYSERRYDPYE